MEENSAIQMSSSQRKRYRDRERYLQMTQDQREVYLQRSREYKRLRRDEGEAYLQRSRAYKRLRRDESSCVGSHCSDIDASGRLNICHPSVGSDLNTSPSEIYVSSISSKDQTANNKLVNFGLRKRHRGTNNGYSQVTIEQGEVLLQEGRGNKKKRGSDVTVCSTTNTQGNTLRTEDKIDNQNLGNVSLMHMGNGSSKSDLYQEPNLNIESGIHSDPYDRNHRSLPNSDNFLEHQRSRRDAAASCGRPNTSASGQLNICRPNAGTRFKISPYDIYVSPISSEDQSANTKLIKLGQRKRHHGTNGHSQLLSNQGDILLQKGCDYKKIRGFDRASCTTTGTQDIVGCTNELHEDVIYLPKESLPAVHDNIIQNEENVEYDDDLGDEGLIYSGQGSEFKSFKEPKPDGIYADLYDHVYQNMPSSHHILEQVPNCIHCNARRFQHETPTFCCMSGKIKIVASLIPGELRRLYTSQEPDARYFRDNIRYFNSHFSFTSLGVVLDKRFCNNKSGAYNFRAQGQIYHGIDQLVPKEDGPKHLQLYFYDTDAELQQRFRHSPNLDKDLIRKLSNILSSNPYVKIIWDEVAMTKRQAVEALDRSLQDITGYQLPFGGKVMVFGGDFRQILPIVRRGTRAQIIDASLQKSYLWKDIKQIKLQRNMRAQSDPWFSDFLLRIGNGTEDTIGEDYVRLPEDIVISHTNPDISISKLINDVFPSLEQNGRSASYISARAILSTKNEYVDDLNAMLIDRFPGDEKVYYSFDSAVDDTHNHYPPEFLNSLTPNGLPPHVLRLKINCPVILLRNLDPSNGLCNGTRLIVRAFQENAIDAEIICGQHAGKRVFLPRIPMYPSEDDVFPFKFKRKQFPIRLSFAMTINKAQGQTIPNVGIYLPEPVFSHGQLYVALSRGTSRKSTRILAKPNNEIDPSSRSTKNIVYRDVLL